MGQALAKSKFHLASQSALVLMLYSLAVALFNFAASAFVFGFWGGAIIFGLSLPKIAILMVFVLFLGRDNKVAAGLFALWCLFLFFGAISGGGDVLANFIGYGQGVFAFVGMVGVFQGFFTERTP